MKLNIKTAPANTTSAEFAQFLADFERQCVCYPKNYYAILDKEQKAKPVRVDPLSPMQIALRRANLL